MESAFWRIIEAKMDRMQSAHPAPRQSTRAGWRGRSFGNTGPRGYKAENQEISVSDDHLGGTGQVQRADGDEGKDEAKVIADCDLDCAAGVVLRGGCAASSWAVCVHRPGCRCRHLAAVDACWYLILNVACDIGTLGWSVV